MKNAFKVNIYHGQIEKKNPFSIFFPLLNPYICTSWGDLMLLLASILFWHLPSEINKTKTKMASLQVISKARCVLKSRTWFLICLEEPTDWLEGTKLCLCSASLNEVSSHADWGGGHLSKAYLFPFQSLRSSPLPRLDYPYSLTAQQFPAHFRKSFHPWAEVHFQIYWPLLIPVGSEAFSEDHSRWKHFSVDDNNWENYR